jgi:hypothetical protein
MSQQTDSRVDASIESKYLRGRFIDGQDRQGTMTQMCLTRQMAPLNRTKWRP